MKFLEKDLEQIIWEADKWQLEERGLYLHGKLFRQFKIGNYGIADLINVEKQYDGPSNPYLKIQIIELKQDKVGVSAFLQAIRYARGVQRYLEKRNFTNYKLSIILIGNDIDTGGAICFLPDLIGCHTEYETSYITSLKYYTYEYKFDGVYFNEASGYKLNDEGFKR